MTAIRGVVVIEAMSTPDPDAPADADPWAEIALIARLVDRQLEDVRSTYGSAEDTGFDLIRMHVRRSAAEVAERCAGVRDMPELGDAAVQTARRLASVSALAVLALRAGDANDVVAVLGDAVAERFRSMVHAVTEGSSSWPPPNFAMPVELFIGQLPEHDPTTETWRLATIWVAMSLKIAEAAIWWRTTDDPGPRPSTPGEPR